MSKFCIDLEGIMLPDAIAAVVEAWYEAQNCTPQDKSQIDDLIPMISTGTPIHQPSADVRLIDWAKSVGLSRSTVYELIKLLDIEPVARRIPGSRRPASHLTVEHVRKINPWASKIASGMTLPEIRDSIANQRMAI